MGVHDGEEALDLLYRQGKYDEKNNGRTLEVTEDVLEEVLDTGLFSSRGPNLMGWAHQTYAEFLAVWYLDKHEISLEKIKSLTFLSDSMGNYGIVPQLEGVITWLARQDVKFAQTLLEHEPMLLAQAGVNLPLSDAKKLIDKLLNTIDTGDESVFYLSSHQNYPMFSHEGLVEKLRDVITDSDCSDNKRQAAIRISRLGKLKGLAANIADIVLDKSNSIEIRSIAVSALEEFDSTEECKRIHALIPFDGTDDTNDELRGSLLKLLWPGYMTSAELFSMLTSPKHESHFGAYWSFLHKLPSSLLKEHLQDALVWVQATDLSQQYREDWIKRMLTGILNLAYENLNKKKIREMLFETFLKKSMQIRLLSSYSTSDDELKPRKMPEPYRCELLKNYIHDLSLISDQTKQSELLWQAREIFSISRDDVPWMLDMLDASEPQSRALWGHFIREYFDPLSSQIIDKILSCKEKYPEFHDLMRNYVDAVPLESKRADQMRECWRNMNRETQEEREERETENWFSLFNEYLESASKGQKSDWCNLANHLQSEPHTRRNSHELSELPGWEIISENEQQQVLQCAQIFLEDYTPNPEDWVGTETYIHGDIAGYKALYLLFLSNSKYVKACKSKFWQEWAGAIIAYPFFSYPTQDSTHHALVALAYVHAKEESLRTLEKLMRKEDGNIRSTYLAFEFEDCWDDCLSEFLIDLIQKDDFEPREKGKLLRKLMEHGFEPSFQYARKLIEEGIGEILKDPIRAQAACSLMEYCPDAGWDYIAPFFYADFSFAKKLLAIYANRMSRHPGRELISKLTNKQLADLYIWLEMKYPHSRDILLNEYRTITYRDDVQDFRNSLLASLRDAGSPEAVAEIKRISKTFPHLGWLRRTENAALEILRKKQWDPPSPGEILQLLHDDKSRMITSSRELLDVIIELLGKLQDELKGEIPAVIDLWDGQNKTGEYKPKDENGFSDYLARFFLRELGGRPIMISREARIHRGEETDIHIDAVVFDDNANVVDKVSVVIEVKGCWNNGLLTSTRSQLVDRYLSGTPIRSGLYLTGYFHSADWDKSDSRRHTEQTHNFDTLKKELAEQAETLSAEKGLDVRSFLLDCSL